MKKKLFSFWDFLFHERECLGVFEYAYNSSKHGLPLKLACTLLKSHCVTYFKFTFSIFKISCHKSWIIERLVIEPYIFFVFVFEEVAQCHQYFKVPRITNRLLKSIYT